MDNEDGDADRAHWSRVADQWIAWARAPGHDAFWAYRDALLAFVGPGTGAALDVGCGEGRVARALKSLGYRVTAVDPVEQFVAAAAAADSADAYAVAPAATLPFAPASFDLAMAYNMLMDVQDVPAALAGIRRVLRPDGACCAPTARCSSRSCTPSSTAASSPMPGRTRRSCCRARISAASVSRARKRATA